MFYVVCFVRLNVLDAEFVIYIDLSWNDPVKLPVFSVYLQNIIIKKPSDHFVCLYVFYLYSHFVFVKLTSDLCNYVFHHMFVVFILSPSAVRVAKLVKFIVVVFYQLNLLN